LRQKGVPPYSGAPLPLMGMSTEGAVRALCVGWPVGRRCTGAESVLPAGRDFSDWCEPHATMSGDVVKELLQHQQMVAPSDGLGV
jgi:hypothetical protein